MNHIRENTEHISCGMPDGDNQKSTIIYKDNLNVSAYTRDIADIYGGSDLISLVMYVKAPIYFRQSDSWKRSAFNLAQTPKNSDK